jgi:hypothetical protein
VSNGLSFALSTTVNLQRSGASWQFSDDRSSVYYRWLNQTCVSFFKLPTLSLVLSKEHSDATGLLIHLVCSSKKDMYDFKHFVKERSKLFKKTELQISFNCTVGYLNEIK